MKTIKVQMSDELGDLFRRFIASKPGTGEGPYLRDRAIDDMAAAGVWTVEDLKAIAAPRGKASR